MKSIRFATILLLVCFLLASCSGSRKSQGTIQFLTVSLKDTCVVGDTYPGVFIQAFDVQAANLVDGLPGVVPNALNNLILRSLFNEELVEEYFHDSWDVYSDIEAFLSAISSILEEQFAQDIEHDVPLFGWDPEEGYTEKAEYYGTAAYKKGDLLSYRWEWRVLDPAYEFPMHVNALCCNLATMERIYLEDIFAGDPETWYIELLDDIKELYPDDYWMIPEFWDQMEIMEDEDSEVLGNFLFDEEGMHFHIELMTTETFEYVLPWEMISPLFTKEFSALIKGR